MKNQCSQCIRKQTMKMEPRIILAGCFVIVMLNNFGTGIKVSSKIDLDSDENEETLDNSTFVTIVNPKKSANPDSSLRASKSSTYEYILRHGNEFIKANEPRKRRIYLSQDDSAKQPNIINNIEIVINSNDSTPNENPCEHGVCNVSVSSKSDEKGNIITEVHLSIMTKGTKAKPKIDDVPVINGFRGANEDYNKQPSFHPINSPRSMHTHLHRDNVPRIQTNYQGYQPWYERTFQRPQMYWNDHFRDHGNDMGFWGKTWRRDKPIVDDKIAPPLSKTKPNDNTKL